ncbi:hypothetical protein SEUCBS139899_010282 [Sporothrix eucalyptigena]|uniref:IgE-binding protein n=1 Tax=Sporothrix eucalyptigena TaxID=1812306 RepID=A0ABP0CRB8_9PEZI
MRLLSLAIGRLECLSLALPLVVVVGPYASNQLIYTGGDVSVLSFQPTVPSYQAGQFSLDASNYLMSGSKYVALYPANNGVYTVTPSSLSAISMLHIVCTPPVVAGTALSCAPVGLPTYQWYVNPSFVTNNPPYMYAPSTAPGYVVGFDIFPEAITS